MTQAFSSGVAPSDERGHRRLFDQHRRQCADARSRSADPPTVDQREQLTAAVERDTRHVSAADAIVVANDDELLEMPAVRAAAGRGAASPRSSRNVPATIPTPSSSRLRPCCDRSRSARRASPGAACPGTTACPRRSCAVERAPGNPEVRRAEAADAELEAAVCDSPVARLARRRVPVRIEMREQRRCTLRRRRRAPAAARPDSRRWPAA